MTAPRRRRQQRHAQRARDERAATVAAALLQPPGDRARRSIQEEIDRQIGRVLWRAERRSRKLPFNVRQSAPWVHAQRRKIAQEIIRATRSLGASSGLATAIATRACERFPRDGVVIVGTDARPRSRGDAPRQHGTNPRARGSSPRQRGTSPRQRRAAADLSGLHTSTSTTPPASTESPLVASQSNDPTRPIEELAPGWNVLKQSIYEELEPHERRRALKNAREQRERLQRSQDSHSPPSDNA